MKFNFRFPKEKFLILQILPADIRGLLVSVDADKRLVVKNFPLGEAARLRPKFKGQVILAADSRLAHTTFLPLNLVRDNSAEPMPAIELENLLSQAVGQVYTECRARASATLNADALDVILVSTRVDNFAMDGHAVVTPVGVRGKTITAELELVLTTRQVFDRCTSAVPLPANFFFTEIEKAEAQVLQKITRGSVNVANLSEDPASFYSINRKNLATDLARGTLAWSPRHLDKAIQAMWQVSLPTAAQVYVAYLSAQISGPMRRALAKPLVLTMRALTEELAQLGLKGTVYLNYTKVLPVALPYRYRGLTLAEIPVDKVLAQLGLSLGDRAEAMPNQAFLSLAPFLQFYFEKRDSDIDKWLKRHLHWLGSPV